MKNLEKFFVTLWILSLLGVFMNLDYTKLLAITTTSFLASFYFYATLPLLLRLSFKNALRFDIYKRIGGKDLIRMIFSGLAFSTQVIAISLVVLDLDSENIISIIGLLEAFIVWIILNFPKAYRQAIYFKDSTKRLYLLSALIPVVIFIKSTI